jgi:hypothetical protein
MWFESDSSPQKLAETARKTLKALCNQ